jgi:hypothetical protein
LFKTGENLRLVADVTDDTPNQTASQGFLRSGGDCLAFAIDDGGKYREYGFALRDGVPSGYEWDGRYGLESARDAKGRINSIVRNGNLIRYDVTVPRGTAKRLDLLGGSLSAQANL